MNRLFQFMAVGILITVVLGSCQKRQEPQQEQSTARKPALEDTVREYLQGYIKGYTSSTGYFVIHDSVEQRDRQLTLRYIHPSVHQIGEGRYSICVDFVEETAQTVDTLDVDFYLAGGDGKIPTVEKVFIHKVNGKPRQ
ncbi:MAG: hypothetical protein D6681_22250 [Calditrichaeota bacterium]|nr:MAG: hypothetical protein D6681_22250 [Calditrichota bacterium]